MPRNYGTAYKIKHKGLELDAINFAEPADTGETQADGTRRGPRSGIGNSNSVWLTQQSAIDLMAKLGFPYHETVKIQPAIPRYRTCFFRTPPRPKQPLPALLRPLPKLLPHKEAISRIRERDISYIHHTGEPVLLLGHEPMLSTVRQDLIDADIAISEAITLPGEAPPSRHVLNELTNDKSGLVVVATSEVVKTIHGLMLMDRFDYAFASFAMARQ